MKPATLIIVSMSLGAAVRARPALRASRAAGRAAEAVAFQQSVVEDAAEVRRLRTTRPAISAGKRPQPNVYAHLTDALVEAGLPAHVLKDVTPGEDSSIRIDGAPGNYRRQSMRVTLESLTLPQTGRFLDAWRVGQPEWTIASMQLTPMPGKGRDKAGDTPRALRISIVMEATYLDVPQGKNLP